MPIVTIVMFEGRTEEMKRRLAKKITDSIVEILGSTGATAEGTTVIFQEVPKRNIATAGILASDKK